MREYFYKEIDTLGYWLSNHPGGKFANTIVQGYPHFGSEIVINGVKENLLKKASYRIVDIKLSDFTVRPISFLVQELRRQLDDAIRDIHMSYKNFAVKYGTHFIKDGQITCIIIREFDRVLKFEDEHYKNFYQLLDKFQIIGSNKNEYKTVFLVDTVKDIELICKSYNYSEFYKIFSDKRLRIKPRDKQDIDNYINKNFQNAANRIVTKIREESGGILELAETLCDIYMTHESPKIEDKLERLYPIFDIWINEFEENFLDVFYLIIDSEEIPSKFREAEQKLIRSGLISQENNKYRIFSSLFAYYLKTKQPTKYESSKVCIQKKIDLPENHVVFFEKLFSNYYLLNYSVVQNLPGQATVYLIEGENAKGEKYRPQILKVHLHLSLEKEKEKIEEVRKILGPAIPIVTNYHIYHSLGGLSVEYASSENVEYKIIRFDDYFKTSPNDDIKRTLNRLFGILGGFYKNVSFKEMKTKHLMYVPKDEEIQQLKDIAEKSSFFFNQDQGIFSIKELNLELKNPASVFQISDNPNSAYQKYLHSKHKYALCQVHGDLNIRNILIDGVDNIHLIDFSTYKENGARFSDFTRLETEIRFKLSNIATKSELIELILLEQICLRSKELNYYKTISNLSLSSNLAKQIVGISTIRECALKYTNKHEDIVSIIYEYQMCLLINTLRILLFQDYLDEFQKEFALIYVSLLIDYLEQNVVLKK